MSGSTPPPTPPHACDDLGQLVCGYDECPWVDRPGQPGESGGDGAGLSTRRIYEPPSTPTPPPTDPPQEWVAAAAWLLAEADEQHAAFPMHRRLAAAVWPLVVARETQLRTERDALLRNLNQAVDEAKGLRTENERLRAKVQAVRDLCETMATSPLEAVRAYATDLAAALGDGGKGR